MKLRSLSVACLSLAAALAAHAADLASGDQSFVSAAAASGMTEVQVSELGAKKAASAEVKALAEKMIKDHTALNAELKTLASSKGVTPSAVLDADASKTLKDLENTASGADFDKAFLKVLRDGHEKSVKNFKDAAENAKDGDVKAFAQKNLPTIEAHLEHIKGLQK